MSQLSLLTNGQTVAPAAAAHRMGGVTFDPRYKSSTGTGVGTTVGTNLIDGTLYLSKIEGPYPFTTITDVARDFTGAFAAANGGTPAMVAEPVYYSDGTNLIRLGIVDLVNNASLASGPVNNGTSTSGVSINWTLPKVGMTVYVGFVCNVPYATGTPNATGGIRVPSGAGSGASNWLTASNDEPGFCTGGTGITTVAAIPSTIALTALSTGSLPNGPFLYGLRP